MKAIRLVVLVLLAFGALALPAGAQDPCGEMVTVESGDTLARIAERCDTTVDEILEANPDIDNPNLISVGQTLTMPLSDPEPDDEAGIYSVRGPETLPEIAERYGTTVESILEANPEIDDADDIEMGQVLALPPDARQPDVEISPTAGPAGTEIEIDAGDFPPETTLTVAIGRVAAGFTATEEATTDDEGNLTATITLPTEAQPEEGWVVVVQTPDLPRVRATSAEFSVTEADDEDEDETTYTVESGDTLFSIAQRVDTTVEAIVEANPDIEDANVIEVGQEIVIPNGVDGNDEVARFDTVQVPLIRLDAGDLGCGDALEFVEIPVAPTRAPLTATLRELLAIDPALVDEEGLYDALAGSDLAVDVVRVINGVATIELTGTLVPGGVCDLPRIDAQLSESALRFDTVDEVNVFIDGEPLEDLLDLRG
jgi:LysM repeat protein